MKMNPRIQLAVRNADCTACKMHVQADGKDRCVTAEGNHKSKVLIVSKTPMGDRSRKELFTYLDRAGFAPEELVYTGAIKCLVWDLTANKTDQKSCKPYLDAEIEMIKPEWVIALGNEALFAAAGKSGIMKHRGLTYTRKDGVKVVSTIAPSMIYRNPGLKGGFEADLAYFRRLVYGDDVPEGNEPDPDQYHKVMTKADLKNFINKLGSSGIASIDIESNGFDEFKPDAKMVSLAVTIEWDDYDEPQPRTDVFAIPLYHPESPWRRVWQRVLQLINAALTSVKKRIAHNGKFDGRWLAEFGCPVDLTFDTMLAAHLLDENRPKGLKPLARQLLGAEPWAIDTKDLLNEPLDDVLWYNALDTWHTLRIYRLLRKDMMEQPRLAKLFQHIIMPASNTLVGVERIGIYAYRDLIHQRWAESQSELDRVDAQLMEWVPDKHPFQKEKRRRGGHIEQIEGINFNPSNFAKWWLFDHLGFPVLARGKEKDNGESGDPSMAEAVMLDLQDKHPHPVIDLMLERTKWQKYTSSFFSAYAEQIDDNDRIHTTFKITGTVTGRLSSGKADADKVTAKVQNRGVNMQQVPRDKFVRGVFGSQPGWIFCEFDYSQIELRMAAFLAQEPTMLRLYNTGQDIHTTMAMRMTGKPWHGGHCDCGGCVTQEERKKAKAVNFGFLYGMGWFKFISTAWANYGVRVTEAEAKAFRRAFFDEFKLLLKWHAGQRAFAHKYGYVLSPLGRKRNLPDIHSRSHDVKAEAERQAINSPVQAFASDMALWSMVLVDRKFKKLGMDARPIGTVHDAVNWEIPRDELGVALPIIKDTMENLPLKKVFDVDLNVPVIADCKLGTHWGGSTEIGAESIYDWDDRVLEGIA
jgi:uracil-DNA glycosylase family 4